METKDIMAIIGIIIYIVPFILFLEMVLKDLYFENAKFGLCLISFLLIVFLNIGIIMLFLITIPIKPLNKKVCELADKTEILYTI